MYTVGKKFKIKFTNSDDITFYSRYGVKNGDILEISLIDSGGDLWLKSKTQVDVCINRKWLQPILSPSQEFCQGFYQFILDNPDIEKEFDDAWHNANIGIVRSIVSDYLIEFNP